LACRGHQDIEIALLEDRFTLGAHRHYCARWLVAEEDGRGHQAPGRTIRHMGDSQAGSSLFKFRTDEQWLPALDYVFGKCLLQLARALRQDAILYHFEFEVDLVSLLKSDIEVTGIENLSQLGLNDAQNLVLVQT